MCGTTDVRMKIAEDNYLFFNTNNNNNKKKY